MVNVMSGDGMSTMISALTDSSTGITSSSLWTEVAAAAPLIVTIFIFAFGYRVIRKVLKSGSKGKANC